MQTKPGSIWMATLILKIWEYGAPKIQIFMFELPLILNDGYMSISFQGTYGNINHLISNSVQGNLSAARYL